MYSQTLRCTAVSQEASLCAGHRFVDVGSGLGKLVLAAACVTDEVQCCGVEISPFRYRVGWVPVMLQRTADQFSPVVGCRDGWFLVQWSMVKMY